MTDELLGKHLIYTNPETQKLLVSEVELVYKTKIPLSDRPEIRRSKDSFHIFRLNWSENKIGLIEQCKVLYLNACARVLAIQEHSSGGATATVVDPRTIFAAALKLNAAMIILCHNHPSGNLLPSDNDKNMTEKIRVAGNMLDIKLCDHLIISSSDYYSFADEGLL